MPCLKELADFFFSFYTILGHRILFSKCYNFTVEKGAEIAFGNIQHSCKTNYHYINILQAKLSLWRVT